MAAIAAQQLHRRTWGPGEQYDPRKHVYTAGRRFYGRRDPNTRAILPSHRYNDEASPTHVSGYIHHGDEEKGEDEFFWYDLIGLDIDVNKAREDWIIEGHVNYEKFIEWLQTTELFQYVGYVVRTASGGIHILLPIRPIITKKGQDWGHSTIGMAVTVQQIALALLSAIGLPPDPAAVGLHRMWANFNDQKNVLYKNEILIKRLQSSKCKEKHLTELLRVVRNEAKKAQPKRLYPDARVESKLANLWFDLLDSHMGRKSYTRADLIAFGFSYPFIARIVENEIPWLNCRVEKYHEEADKLCLSLCDNAGIYASRAHVLDMQSAFGGLRTLHSLSAPECVADGERNHWLWSIAVLLKHNGYELSTAEKVVAEAAARMPGCVGSRNCHCSNRIVRSIYRNHPELFGVCPRALPEWMCNILISLDSNKQGRSPEGAGGTHARNPQSNEGVAVLVGVPGVENGNDENRGELVLIHKDKFVENDASFEAESTSDEGASFQGVTQSNEGAVVLVGVPGPENRSGMVESEFVLIYKDKCGSEFGVSEEVVEDVAEKELRKAIKIERINVSRLSLIDFSGRLADLAQKKVDALESKLSRFLEKRAKEPEQVLEVQDKKLVIVYHRNRIGIFDDSKLLKCLCIGWYRKRFWRAGEAQQKLESELGCKVKLWFPRKVDCRMAEWHRAIDGASNTQSAAGWLGRGDSKVVKLDEWREKKGVAAPAPGLRAPWTPKNCDEKSVPF